MSRGFVSVLPACGGVSGEGVTLLAAWATYLQQDGRGSDWGSRTLCERSETAHGSVAAEGSATVTAPAQCEPFRSTCKIRTDKAAFLALFVVTGLVMSFPVASVSLAEHDTCSRRLIIGVSMRCATPAAGALRRYWDVVPQSWAPVATL